MDTLKPTNKDLEQALIQKHDCCAVKPAPLSAEQGNVLSPKTVKPAYFIQSKFEEAQKLPLEHRYESLAFQAKEFVDRYGQDLHDQNGKMPKNVKALLVHLPEQEIAALPEKDQASIYEAQATLMASTLLDSDDPSNIELVKQQIGTLRGKNAGPLQLRLLRNKLMDRAIARAEMTRIRPNIADWEEKKEKKNKQEALSIWLIILNAGHGGEQMANYLLGMSGGIAPTMAMCAVENSRTTLMLDRQAADLSFRDTLDLLVSVPVQEVSNRIERAESAVEKFSRSVFLHKDLLLVSEDATMRNILSSSVDYKKASNF